MADVLGTDDRPARRPSRRVLLLVGLAVVTGLVVADQVRDRRADQRVVDLVVLGAAPPEIADPAVVPAPTGPEPAISPVEPLTGPVVRDPVVVLTVRNTGPAQVELVDQRLDGVGPVDRVGRGLPAGRATELDVRWRVLCDEVGSLFGPQRLNLVVRPSRGGERSVSLELDDAARRSFRLRASLVCAAG